MPHIDLELLLQVAAAVTVLGAAAGALAKWVICPLRRGAKSVGSFLEDWNGEAPRPGVPERLGVMTRLATIEACQREVRRRVDVIEAEVKPNSGTSMRDSVDRIEQKLSD